MKKSQNEVVLQLLKDHGFITTYHAFRHGITRLPARIWDLRHKYGIEITSERRSYKAKDGKYKHYDIYKLGEHT